MQYNRMTLGRQAKELGFVRDTFEKVCRLAEVLAFVEQDDILNNSLALKGGTAINLTIFDLPRLSVDIDLDLAENLSREAMLEQRSVITERLEKQMAADGYTLSPKSKHYHALDSFVFEYLNTGGMKDNLKIEINYMLRCHVMELRRREVRLPWMDRELTVLSVDPTEIFASKTVALISRAAPRDLYDLNNMLKYSLFDESEQELLRKCIVFYSAIGAEDTPLSFSFDSIQSIRQNKIKTDLLPVLRNGVYFDAKTAQNDCVEYLKRLLILTDQETGFLQAFRDKQYRPELLFSDSAILERISGHPMALWKCGKRT
jgi:predicted nucleotidyltransferase component of viral defense system